MSWQSEVAQKLGSTPLLQNTVSVHQKYGEIIRSILSSKTDPVVILIVSHCGLALVSRHDIIMAPFPDAATHSTGCSTSHPRRCVTCKPWAAEWTGVDPSSPPTSTPTTTHSCSGSSGHSTSRARSQRTRGMQQGKLAPVHLLLGEVTMSPHRDACTMLIPSHN